MDWQGWGMALAGGIMIGGASTMLMALNHRIAGISGIFGGLVDFERSPERAWRAAFIGGLILGGVILSRVWGERFGLSPLATQSGPLFLAGLLVGFGTRLGGGCTSGHGVCGLSRLSGRSFTATLSFIGFGVLTVAVIRTLANLGFVL